MNVRVNLKETDSMDEMNCLNDFLNILMQLLIYIDLGVKISSAY